MKGRILALGGKEEADILTERFEEICQGFKENGYVVQVFDYTVNTLEDLRRMPFSQYRFIFCFNSSVHADISEVLPATTIAVAFMDSSIIHYIRMKYHKCMTYIGIHTDRYGKEFADKYFSDINANYMIPHGGSCGRKEAAFPKRMYEVVCFGKYRDPQKIMNELCVKWGEYSDVLIDILSIFLDEDTISMETAFRRALSQNNITLSDEAIGNLVLGLTLEREYINAYSRDLVVRTLIEAGQEVDVYGSGWAQFQGDGMQYLHIHEPADGSEILSVMGNAKIVLNITPTLNNGSHEIIFSAMQSGAVCFTNTNLYLIEEKLEEAVVMFSLKDMQDLPQMIQMVLDNEKAAVAISNYAKEAALTRYSWKSIAEQVAGVVEDYVATINYELKEYHKKVDFEFYSWAEFIRNHTEQFLFEKMKGGVLARQYFHPQNTQSLFNAYNTYGYWGKCDPKCGEYELLWNRAREVKNSYREILWMYSELMDARSKSIYYHIFRHWMDYSSFHLEKLSGIFEQYFDHDLIKCNAEEVFVDIGAYVGDTFQSYVNNYRGYKKYYCYEVFDENMKICKDYMDGFDNIVFRQCAVGDKEGVARLNVSDYKSMNTVADEGEYEVPMVTLDRDIKEPVTFIKMDIEGGELAAIWGAREHIKNDHPKLAIACYHNNYDIWRLAKAIKEIDDSYQFYLRYYGSSYYPSEYVLYGI